MTSTSALDFEASVSLLNSLHVLIILFYHMMVLKLFFENVISDHWQMATLMNVRVVSVITDITVVVGFVIKAYDVTIDIYYVNDAIFS